MSTKTVTLRIWDAAYFAGVLLASIGIYLDKTGGLSGALIFTGVGTALWATVRGIVHAANS